MRILIETILHSAQRYPTVGDWQWMSSRIAGFQNRGTETDKWHPKDTLHIRVSEMSDWRYEALVGLHEVIEALLCKQRGVTEQQVDQFDLDFGLKAGEPGDDPDAPYHQQHLTATAHEKALALAFDVHWAEYEREVDSL